jgi:hypothetical protein
MFKRFWNWLIDLPSKCEESTTQILDAFEDAAEDTAEFISDIKKAMQDDKKQLLVEVRVGKSTKMRPLKAAMESTLVDMLVKQYPECTDLEVKFFYYKKK